MVVPTGILDWGQCELKGHGHAAEVEVYDRRHIKGDGEDLSYSFYSSCSCSMFFLTGNENQGPTLRHAFHPHGVAIK